MPSSFPNKKSCAVLDLLINPIPAPKAAPAIGPITEPVNIEAPTPNTAPAPIAPLLSNTSPRTLLILSVIAVESFLTFSSSVKLSANSFIPDNALFIPLYSIPRIELSSKLIFFVSPVPSSSVVAPSSVLLPVDIFPSYAKPKNFLVRAISFFRCFFLSVIP